jgi:hypothetical protein
VVGAVIGAIWVGYFFRSGLNEPQPTAAVPKGASTVK